MEHLCPASSLTFDLDIQELRVNTEGQVAWQCPGRGRPSDQSHFLIVNQWEVDNHRWVLNILETKNETDIKWFQHLRLNSTLCCWCCFRPVEGWDGCDLCQPCSSGGTQSWTAACCRQWRKAWLWHLCKPDLCRTAVWTPTWMNRRKKLKEETNCTWENRLETWTKSGLYCMYILLYIAF